jgi:hypothetical protein
MSATLLYPNNQKIVINYFNKIQKNISNILKKNKYYYISKVK